MTSCLLLWRMKPFQQRVGWGGGRGGEGLFEDRIHFPEENSFLKDLTAIETGVKNDSGRVAFPESAPIPYNWH